MTARNGPNFSLAAWSSGWGPRRWGRHRPGQDGDLGLDPASASDWASWASSRLSEPQFPTCEVWQLRFLSCGSEG